MPGKETIYFSKSQLQRLCELYRFEDNLWKVSSSGYHKTDKRNASLDRIKETMMEEFQDIQPFTGNFLLCLCLTSHQQLRSYGDGATA